MMQPAKKKRFASLLGLSFDGARLEGVVLKRTNGSARAAKVFAVTVTLDLLKDDPELAAREIRNHLEQAGIRERNCAVCVPLEWALFTHTRIPDLPEEDVTGFLAIEAERTFPYSPETLSISLSRQNFPGGERYASQIAFPREHLTRLETVLRGARLNPVTFSLGVSALQNPEEPGSEGVIALLTRERGIALQISGGGGISALRTIESAFEVEAGVKRYLLEVIAREIRVTLGQLPPSARAGVSRLRVFGRDARRLAEALRPWAASVGLATEAVLTPGETGLQLPSDAENSAALNLAARVLAGTAPSLEFLPPRISVWQRFARKHSAKKLVWAGAAGGLAAMVVALAFLVQQWQLSRLQSRWSGMSAKARELEELQARIKRFRPWFDESFRALSILKKLAESFPEEGAVTARTLEIRNASSVFCSGVTRDQQALLKVLDQLRASREVANVTLDMVRGQNPMQFTFNFQWTGGASEH